MYDSKFQIISSKNYFNIKKHSPVYKNFKNFMKDKNKNEKGFLTMTLKNFSQLRKFKSQRNYSKTKNSKNLKIKILNIKKKTNKFKIKYSYSSKSTNKLHLKNKQNWNQFDKILNKIPVIIKTESGIKKKNLLLENLKPKKHFKINITKKENIIICKKNKLKTSDNIHLQNFNNYLKQKKTKKSKSKKKLFIKSNIDKKYLKNNLNRDNIILNSKISKDIKNLKSNNNFKNNLQKKNTFEEKNKLKTDNNLQKKNTFEDRKNLLNDSCMDFSWSNYNKFCINHPQYKLFDISSEKIEEEEKKQKEKKKNNKPKKSKKTNLFFFDLKQRIPIIMMTKIKVKTRRKRLNLQKIRVYNHKFEKFKEILSKILLIKPNTNNYLIRDTSLEKNIQIEKEISRQSKIIPKKQEFFQKEKKEKSLNLKFLIDKNLTILGKDIKKCTGVKKKGYFLNLETPYTYINSVSYNSYWMDNVKYFLEADNLYNDVREEVNGYFQLFFQGERGEKFENFIRELIDCFYFGRESNYNLVSFFYKIKLDLMTNHKFFSKAK